MGRYPQILRDSPIPVTLGSAGRLDGPAPGRGNAKPAGRAIRLLLGLMTKD